MFIDICQQLFRVAIADNVILCQQNQRAVVIIIYYDNDKHKQVKYIDIPVQDL